MANQWGDALSRIDNKNKRLVPIDNDYADDYSTVSSGNAWGEALSKITLEPPKPQPINKPIDLFNLNPIKQTSPFIQLPQDVYAEAYKTQNQPSQEYIAEQKQKEYADKWFEEHTPEIVNNTLKLIPDTINRFRDTKPGQFAERIGERGLATAVFDPEAVKTTTGNKYADIVADALGSIAGLITPTGGANAALSGGRIAGQTTMERLLPNVTNRVANAAVKGYGAGAGYVTARDISEGKNAKEIGRDLLTEAPTFAALDAAALYGPVKSGLAGLGIFGGQSALAGDKPEDIAINALTGLGLGVLGGAGNRTAKTPKVNDFPTPKTWQRQAIENIINKPKFEAKRSNPLEGILPKQKPVIEPRTVENVQSNINPLAEEIKTKFKTLDEEVKSSGFNETNPQTIAKTYNNKTWYHGTGTKDLKVENLDPFIGNHEGLFGNGIYLTDSPEIAKGYANARSKRSKTPTIYEAKTNIDKVVDLEKPITPDVVESFTNGTYSEFKDIVKEAASKPNATPESVFKELKQAIRDHSEGEGIPTSEYVEMFQDIVTSLKESGYDGVTHTGGLRTGKAPHKVLILLDPNDYYAGTGRKSQVTQFNPIEQLKPQPNTNVSLSETKPPMEEIKAPKPTLNEKIDNAITYFDQVEANARKRIESRKSRLNSFPVEDLGDYAVIGASKMAKGGLEFTKWSNEMVGEFGDEIKPHLDEIYNHAKNIYNNHTTNTLPDTSKVIATKTKGDGVNIPERANRAYIGLVDDLHRINQFDKFSEKTTGEKITSDNSAYQKGLNSRGSDIIAKQILTDRLVDPKGNVIGEGFSSITKQIPKGLETKFEDYLINRHAPSWMEQGRKVFPDKMGMTPELSIEKVRQYEAEYPQFKQIADQYQNFMTNIVQKWGVDTGLISQESFDLMRSMYPDYVPLQREFKTIEKPRFGGAKKSFANQNAPIKKATGSERPIISPIESTIETIDKLVKTAKRNEVMQTIIKRLDTDPKGLEGFAKIVKGKEDLIGDINSTLKEDGIEGVIEKFNQQFDEIYSRNKNLNKGNIVSGLVDGKKVHIEVNDPQMLDALTSLSDRSRHIVIDFVGGATRIMKNLTTGINPVFSLARNIFRDIPTSFINSKTTSNPARFANDLVGSFVSILAEGVGDSKTANKVLPKFASSWAKNQGELFKSYKEVGGGHSSSISTGRNALKESKNEILQTDYKKNPLKLIPRVASKGMGALERFNNAIETAPRLAEYKRLSKTGDKQQGLFEANDVTVNFKRRGKIGKDIDAFVPYFNAAIQGLDKMARVYKDNPAKAIAKSVLAVTIPTIYLYSVNHDNPDYQKLNNYTKDNNFLFPNDDGTFTKIPKPREVGVVFGSLVERSLRQWNDNDPEAFREFIETVKANFTPPTRTIVHPVIRDLPSNKDFIDRPIVPMALEKLSPRYQYDEKTSEISKKIGDIFNLSPKKIDYTAKSYLGVLAQLGIPATSKGATIKDTLKQQVTVDPLYSNDILNRFYETKEKLDTAYNDFKATGEMGGKSKEQFAKDMAKRKQINKISSDFSDIRKLIKKVGADQSLTEAQKKEKVKQYMLKMQDMANSIK